MQATRLLDSALKQIFSEMELPVPEKLVIEAPKDPRHGDLSTNAALLLARTASRNPRDLAAAFAERLLEICPQIARAEAAGPGFCTVTFRPDVWLNTLVEIEEKKGAFGSSSAGIGQKVLVEYVSANPTGPLHVGHGRGAAVGDSVARLLRFAGFKVNTEYYLNDSGRQMNILGRSIWLRVLEKSGRKINFPDDCYQGGYIADLADALLKAHPSLPDLSAKDGIPICKQYGMDQILDGIKYDLKEFRCEHESFFSEKSLVDSGAVGQTLDNLQKSGRSFHEDGALWFETTSLGDDRNRVLRKSDGSLTYFATDISYHDNKIKRGYNWLVDVWGADHHGYIPRMRAAIHELSANPPKFSVLLIQLVSLLRDGEAVSMSTRAGQFDTLAEVIQEVGADAARFMFLSRSCDSPLDFDLELARRRSMDNPVYYVQYAHARVCALLRRAEDNDIILPEKSDPQKLALLDTDEDLALLRQLAAFEDVTREAALALAPHHVSRYLLDLAATLHAYYARHTIVDVNARDRSIARLALLRGVGQTIRNGLFLLGVTAPETM